MPSPKRGNPDGDLDERATKLRKVEPKLTGLEDLGILDEDSSKVEASTPTKSDSAQYSRRIQVARYAHSIKKNRALMNRRASPKDFPSSARKGMRNFTWALCYRHSLLQALLHLPQFCQWLLKHHRPEDCVHDDKEKCLACHLRVVIEAYWTAEVKELSKVLRALDTALLANGWKVGSINQQGDPEEQLGFITKKMSETLPRSVFELFQASNCGIMDSHVICDHCGYVSKTDGHVVGAVSVPLQPRIDSGNLSMYLEKYMDEIVTGYKCDRCKNTSDKHRLQKITHSPDVLLIQLKRFDWRGKKDSEPVRFSSTLNLNPYRDEANKVDSEYELSAVVVHAGSINSGHYICLAKGPDGVWMEFNDLSVSKSSLNAVLDLGTGGGRSKKDNGGWTPYLLFFQRKMK